MVGLAPVASADGVQSQEWHLKAMQAEKMWKVSTGKGIKVAVIDSGVDPSAQALKGRVLPGRDVSGAPGDETLDDVGHGTTMAELIAGSGKGGTLKGLAPGAKIIPFRTSGPGVKGADMTKENLDDALRAAADSDARIINMSLSGSPHPSVKEAVKYATKKGKLLLAGTGNDAKKGNPVTYPAAYPDVAGVAAVDKSGKVADYSTHGNQTILSGPAVGLPGWCDGKKERYCPQGGTSAATAIASASAALIWSHHPDWTANQVLRVLIKTGDLADKPSKYVGYGAVRPRLNLLEGKGKPGDPDISPLTGERTLHTRPDKSGSGEKGSEAEKDAKKTAPDKSKVADSESAENDKTLLWIAVGAGAVVIVLGVAAAVIKRGRLR
jgi:type VII secretion-associated serine protease mycosin